MNDSVRTKYFVHKQFFKRAYICILKQPIENRFAFFVNETSILVLAELAIFHSI